MKELEFFDALTGIDDAYVLEAHETADHRSPVRFSGFRRAVVLAAAVMMLIALSVAAVADKWEITPAALLEKYDDDNTFVYIWKSSGKCYGVERRITDIYGKEDICHFSYVFTKTLAQSYTVSTGQPLLVRLEAMVLMEDGRVEYKSVSKETSEDVQLELDHYVDGEPGTLVHVRCRVYMMTEDGWVKAAERAGYLPNALGFEIPVGTDVRFPFT